MLFPGNVYRIEAEERGLIHIGQERGLAWERPRLVSRLDFKHLLGRVLSFVRFISFDISSYIEEI